MKPLISIIAAMDQHRLIGKANGLPWHLPADLKHFKQMTLGKTVIMGRKTFDSVGKPLPDRRNIIITHDKKFKAPGCTIAYSLEEALALAKADKEIMILGGAEIYAQSLMMADRMYLTFIDATFEGDTYFPQWNANDWKEIARESHTPDEKNHYAYSFVTLARLKPA